MRGDALNSDEIISSPLASRSPFGIACRRGRRHASRETRNPLAPRASSLAPHSPFPHPPSVSYPSNRLRKRKSRQPQVILGWREWVTLPDIGIDAVHAKLDTGARSSALHIVDLETFRHLKQRWVRFWVDPDAKHPDRVFECEARIVDERVVKNSGGRGELRVVIRTAIEIAGRRWPIDLTLTNRSEMRFRMLVGREAMRDRVLVDPMRSDLAGVPESRRGRKRR